MTKTNCTTQKPKTQSWKMGRDEIIRRCIEKHGPDNFDYTHVAEDAAGADCKIDVKCNACGQIFRPRAGSHYNRGTGCPTCFRRALNAAKTTKFENFIAKAREKHGDRYEYPKQIINGKDYQVKIKCTIHGWFHQNHTLHLRAAVGCHKCALDENTNRIGEQSEKQRFTGADFERESRKIYGDLLEYDHSSFISTKKPVRLKCRSHGWFEVNAHAHLYGKAKNPCPDCRAGKLTPAQIRKAISLKHGRKYKYEGNAGNKSPREKITVVCRDHGPQLRILGTLLKGQPCPECEAEKRTRKKTEDLKKMERLREARRLRKEDNFIKRAKKKHKGFYKYDRQAMGFINLSTKINMECPKHGPFSQAPSQHLKAGCPKCAEERTSGWTKKAYIKKAEYANDGRAMLYLIRLTSETEEFYKIGITCKPTVNARFSKKDDLTGIYEIEVVRTVKGDAGFIYDAEKQFHRMNKKHKYKPAKYFAGHTECFSEITDDARFLFEVLQ